jgi:hypothetical protein
MLSGRPRSFSEMQKVFRVESSHLTYHLESLGSLLLKTDDGKYALSSLGEAAVSMMYHVEEPPKTTLHPPLSFKRWKVLLATFMVGVILLSSLCYFQFQTLTQLSGQYLSLKREHGLLQEVLREILGLGNAVLTYEYAENSTVATTFVIVNETGWNSVTSPWGRSLDSYSIYGLTDNSTLEIKISFPTPDQPQVYLFIRVGKEVRVPGRWNCSVTYNGTTTQHYYNERIYYEVLWGVGVTNSGAYSVILPSRGWYMIWIGALSVWNATDLYIVSYAITFQVKGQRDYIPFFVGSRMGGFWDMEFWQTSIPEWTLERKGDP